jgi:hypothetical protein
VEKEEILAEIRRTAKVNGGKPLGRARFEQATGITWYDWSRYWARFGEAQREAEVEPTTLQKAYQDDFLLRILADLTRELERFPSVADLRLKSFQVAGFPNPKTFRRLGNKRMVLSKVMGYCSQRAEYADVATLVQASIDFLKSNGVDDLPSVTDEPKYGFVYLVRGHPGEYKIGRTNLVDRRLSELSVTASVAPQLVHEIKTDDPVGVAAYWHQRFADKRMRGEWFRLGPADVKAFLRWKRIH